LQIFSLGVYSENQDLLSINFMLFWIAVGIFLVSLLFFIFDWVDKTIVAMLGAVMLIVTGVLTWDEAVNAIDFETITLLLGLMITVVIAQHSGIFSWVNTKIAQKSRGNPLAVFLMFIAFTFFSSTVLNNATVVILIIPVAIALAQGLGLNSKLLVIMIAMFSNIGGTLTLIGDPPNTLIGVQVGLSFNDFVKNLFIPVMAMSAAIILYLIVAYWKNLKPIGKDLGKVFISNLIIKRIGYQYANTKIDKYVVIASLSVIAATVVAFAIQPWLGLSVGVIGLLSGLILSNLVFKKVPFLEVLKEIEWDSLLFFSALFVQVGALEKVGFLTMITDFIAGFSGNFVALLLIIVWGIGLASAFINNIPFVALMIPVIYDLQAKLTGQPDLDLLWWALALGACLGGNATIIGSSSGLLAVDMAKKSGVKVSFMDFAKVGFPVTIISLAVSSVYLVAVYYL